MQNAPEPLVSSAELPVFVIDRLAAAPPPVRPRVEVLFDPRTRLIVGFRMAEGRHARPRRDGRRTTG